MLEAVLPVEDPLALPASQLEAPMIICHRVIRHGRVLACRGMIQETLLGRLGDWGNSHSD